MLFRHKNPNIVSKNLQEERKKIVPLMKQWRIKGNVATVIRESFRSSDQGKKKSESNVCSGRQINKQVNVKVVFEGGELSVFIISYPM